MSETLPENTLSQALNLFIKSNGNTPVLCFNNFDPDNNGFISIKVLRAELKKYNLSAAGDQQLLSFFTNLVFCYRNMSKNRVLKQYQKYQKNIGNYYARNY